MIKVTAEKMSVPETTPKQYDLAHTLLTKMQDELHSQGIDPIRCGLYRDVVICAFAEYIKKLGLNDLDGEVKSNSLLALYMYSPRYSDDPIKGLGVEIPEANLQVAAEIASTYSEILKGYHQLWSGESKDTTPLTQHPEWSIPHEIKDLLEELRREEEREEYRARTAAQV